MATEELSRSAPGSDHAPRDRWWSRKPKPERRPFLSGRLLGNLWEFQHPGKVALAAVAGLVAIGMVLAAVFTDLGDRDEATDGIVAETIEIGGSALPLRELGFNDPAVGMRAPDLSGTTFDGSPLAFTADDGPRAVVFLAHWCPNCQAEVEELLAFLETNELPQGVAVQSVSTMASPQRPNYPPDVWLDREGWPFPVIVDDATSSAAEAFGLSGTPFWVFIDGDGRVLQRAGGQIPPEALMSLLDELAALRPA